MRLFRQKKQQISRKREIRNESKEKNMDDFLLKQIDEFRDKAQQLQDLMDFFVIAGQSAGHAQPAPRGGHSERPVHAIPLRQPSPGDDGDFEKF